MAKRKGRFSDLDLDGLLALLMKGGPQVGDVREELLRRATSLVGETIEESFQKSGFSEEELSRAGYLGLLNAAYNVQLSRGKDFREYAKNLIKGEIRQHIRERVKRAPIPRWLKNLNRQLEAAEARLLREKGRLPTLSELADAVNITEQGITEIFKAREALNYVSLSAEQRENDPIPTIDSSKITSKRPDPFPIQYRIHIAKALEELAELQQFLFRSLFPPSAS
jgi:DNA-directed RNA polymerase specialized sigma subunit